MGRGTRKGCETQLRNHISIKKKPLRESFEKIIPPGPFVSQTRSFRWKENKTFHEAKTFQIVIGFLPLKDQQEVVDSLRNVPHPTP